MSDQRRTPGHAGMTTVAPVSPLTLLRERPALADGILAAAFVALTVVIVIGFQNSEIDFGEFDEPARVDNVLEWSLVLLPPAVLALRRIAPIGVALVSVVAQLAIWGLGYPDLTLASMIALYTVVAHGRRPRGVRVGVGLAVLASLFTFAGYLSDETPGYTVALVPLVTTLPIALGLQAAERQRELDRLQTAAVAMEERRDADRRSAIQTERTHIARELHDVVAHGLSVMVVQATAAQRVLDADPEAARRALEMIERSGTESLTEMRRVLGVLRDHEDADPDRTGADELWRPSPGLDRVDDLVDDLRAVGHVVTVERDGDLAGLPTTIGTSAYRVVQEATTNVLKHAGPAVHVGISLRVAEVAPTPELLVTVHDDGRGATARDTGGHGLQGMAERTEVFGGRFDAGPRLGGGFRVEACFPLPQTVTT